MTANTKHEAWLRFVKSAVDVVAGRSKEDLYAFCEIAKHEYPSMVPLIQEYIQLTNKSDSTVVSKKQPARKTGKQMHLFDLLRDKTLFPQNLDLSRFAARVVPELRTIRHDKISRTDIAARIIEHIENVDVKARDALEASMREALVALKGEEIEKPDRVSFVSKWERIIKGLEL